MNINKLMEEFDKKFPVYKAPQSKPYIAPSVDDIKSFLRSAILKTCDEILGSANEAPYATDCGCDGWCPSCQQNQRENRGYNKCRQVIESKVKEIKGEV